jgi:hypothetical protein
VNSYLDIQVHPDFQGLPPNLHAALVHLTDNAAAVLVLVSALGIVVSLLMLVVASWTSSRDLGERARSGLAISILAVAFLYGAVMLANYTGALFG